MQTGVIEQPEPLPPLNELSIIQNAMDKGVSGEQLTLFTNAIAQIEVRKAARIFADAITGFQADCPQIKKKKEGGKTRDSDQAAYYYAPFEDMMLVVGPHMARHKIVATFTDTPSETPGLIRMTCRIRVGIHQETTTIPMPIPKGNALVNGSQLMIQALSYAKRAALTLALNIVTKGEDKDGADLLDTLIAVEVSDLESAMESKNMPLAAFLAFAKADSLESIPRSQFARLLDAIKRTRKKEVQG